MTLASRRSPTSSPCLGYLKGTAYLLFPFLILTTSIYLKHTPTRMSDYRNNPASQYHSPPPRCGCGLDHTLPISNLDRGPGNEQRRTTYEATHCSAQSATSQCHWHNFSNSTATPPPPPRQHNTLQDSAYGPRPPYGLGYGAEIRGDANDQTYGSTAPPFARPPSQIDDRYGPFSQDSMAGDRSRNNAIQTPLPSRPFEREGNDLRMNYDSGGQSHSHINQGPRGFAYHPPAAYPEMPPEREMPTYEGLYPQGHPCSCCCTDCLDITTARLDREKAERERRESERTA
jgi:hypothetical protein